MDTQQAYINGFVKRAADYGYSEDQAIELLKSAVDAASPAGFDMSATADASKVPAPSSAAPGLLGKLRNKFSNMLPGYPTTVGATPGGVDALTRKFEQMGGLD